MKVNERRTVVEGVDWPLCVPPPNRGEIDAHGRTPWNPTGYVPTTRKLTQLMFLDVLLTMQYFAGLLYAVAELQFSWHLAGIVGSR